MLTLVVPALALGQQFMPSGAFLPIGAVALLFAAWGGRRWGLEALAPVLLLSLLFVLDTKWLPGLGNLWMMPLLLVAWRIGADPASAASIWNRQDLTLRDQALFLALAGSSISINGFDPDVRFISAPQGLPLLFLCGAIGASRVRLRTLLAPLLILVAANWLLAPLWPYSTVRPYVGFDFGILPFAAIAACLAFAAGRLLTRDPPQSPILAAGAIAFWCIVFGAALSGAAIELPYGFFGQSASSLLGAEEGQQPVTTVEEMASPLLLFVQTIIVVRLIGASSTRPPWTIVGISAAMAAGACAIAWLLIRAGGPPERLGILSFTLSGHSAAFFAPWALSLSVISAAAFAFTLRWRSEVASPARADDQSFLILLLGRPWTAALSVLSAFTLLLAILLAGIGAEPVGQRIRAALDAAGDLRWESSYEVNNTATELPGVDFNTVSDVNMSRTDMNDIVFNFESAPSDSTVNISTTNGN
ncbi:MAG TPA: hypothetical protein VGB79_04725 [Allosphingosinicella sp.]|jgi:hypothetical protein